MRSLDKKNKRGAGTEVLSPEDFFTQRKLKEGMKFRVLN